MEQAYPYAIVSQKREWAGYDSQNCDACPGREDCVRIYDARCVRAKSQAAIFPCGLRPEKGISVNAILIACGDLHYPHYRPRAKKNKVEADDG